MTHLRYFNLISHLQGRYVFVHYLFERCLSFTTWVECALKVKQTGLRRRKYNIKQKLQRKEKICGEPLAVYFASGQIMEMRWKFSLVCALALYMLNQSKLYLGRHICLSICLWFYRSNYLCRKHKFQWRYETKTTAHFFLFWLQQFIDELPNGILRIRGR